MSDGEYMKHKKELFSFKYIGALLLASFTIISLCYYAKSCFATNGLVCTREHSFILLTLLILIMLITIMFLYILYSNHRTKSLLLQILEDIAESEDNNIEFQRETQRMIFSILDNKNTK